MSEGDRLITKQQEDRIRVLFRMVGISPEGEAAMELQSHAGIARTPWAWRMASRDQAHAMMGVMISFLRFRAGDDGEAGPV